MPHEKYSLTDQVRRSSRSIPANIAEAWSKKIYPKHFLSKLSDSLGEEYETEVWLDFSRDCQYITLQAHTELIEKQRLFMKLCLQRRKTKFADYDRTD